MADWTSFYYQLAVGGLVFAVGMFVGVRTGQLGGSGRGLRRAGWLLAGLVFFAALQAALTAWGGP